MGQAMNVMKSIHTAWISAQIVARHDHSGPRRGLEHRLENAIVETLGKPNNADVYVHWGAYESGKTWAARNAAIRLQAEGKLVMLAHGYDFSYRHDFRSWLRISMGIPKDCENDKPSAFFPSNKQTVLIVDHPDYLIKQYGENDLVNNLYTLGIPVLLLVRSWESAIDLKKQGCLLLGEPGFGRWTEQELDNMYDTFPEHLKLKVEANKPELRECALLAGSPGILEFECHEEFKPNMCRAKLIAAEWENGIRALSGEDMQGVVGKFPDKNGTFHWV